MSTGLLAVEHEVLDGDDGGGNGDGMEHIQNCLAQIGRSWCEQIRHAPWEENMLALTRSSLGDSSASPVVGLKGAYNRACCR